MNQHILKPLSLLVMLLVISFAGCKEKDFNSKENDEQELYNLRSEIDKLSEQVNCENSADWKFTAIGAKGCGGPTGFVAYSTKIDEVLFLKKVDVYTQKQKAFNVKWGVVSDCSLPSAPKSIECVSGKPRFVY